MEEFQSQLLAGLQASQAANSKAIETALGGISEKLSATPAKEEETFLDDADLETLSRSKFMDVILGKMGGVLDDKLKGVTEVTNRNQEQIQIDNVRQDIKDLKDSGVKDFEDWREELHATVKKNPMLSVKDAYILVRSGNADKAKELDEKYTDKSGEVADKTKGFGGMKPGTSTRSESDGKMEASEAKEDAWDQVFGEASDTDIFSGEAAA